MSSQSDVLNAALPPPPARSPRWLPVRSLGVRHRERILTHLIALGDDDRHLRFGQVATDEQIRLYVDHIDFERDELFGIFNSKLRLVAMAHLALAADASSAEFGVSVLPSQRGRGLGARLFEHAVTHARNRGAKSMAIHLARENGPMLAIVRKSGAAVRFEGADAVADLPLPEDTLGSHMGAMVETQAAELDYRMKLQVLRLDHFWQGLLPARTL